MRIAGPTATPPDCNSSEGRPSRRPDAQEWVGSGGRVAQPPDHPPVGRQEIRKGLVLLPCPADVLEDGLRHLGFRVHT